MKTHSFYATLSANIFLNDADFDLLFLGMERHYDFTVKQATKQGGFMYGLRNRRTKFYEAEVIDDESRTIDVSNRELQLLFKSLEMGRTEQSLDIAIRFAKILSEMIEKQNELNTNLIK